MNLELRDFKLLLQIYDYVWMMNMPKNLKLSEITHSILRAK